MGKGRAIGGYFSLELCCGNEYWKNAIRLNSGRNCLRFLVRSYGIKTLFVPSYTCPVVWEALERENCHLEYYAIDQNFMPLCEFPLDAYILYTNYFGVCTDNAVALAQKYPNLIVDCSQSFYSDRIGLASFNSARKFFGVPDGAYLFTDKDSIDGLEQDISSGRASHLLLRTDIDAQSGYHAFHENEDAICRENIKLMSKLTRRILMGIDYERTANIRRSNYEQLHHSLQDINRWTGGLTETDVPMAYPFLCSSKGLRQKLIDEQIFVAKYWSGQTDRGMGLDFEENLLALPIDQRYNSDDMSRILTCIFENL